MCFHVQMFGRAFYDKLRTKLLIIVCGLLLHRNHNVVLTCSARCAAPDHIIDPCTSKHGNWSEPLRVRCESFSQCQKS